MPAKKKPAYLLHKPTGRARVRIDGKDHYLGPHGSQESRDRYDELITSWLHRKEFSSVLLTVDELVLLYLDFAAQYYVKNGKQTSEVHDIKAAVRPLVAICGRMRVREFGPLKLKAVREAMVASGWTRRTVNSQVQRIRRMFRWGVENEHVPAVVLTALAAIAGLRKGKTTAEDKAPIKPVDDATVDTTLEHLPPVVADMVRLQRLTGMRPAEVCSLRPGDVDRSDAAWCYRPASHKTEHHGRERVVFIGPQGQAILSPYLLRGSESFCFSPAESEKKRRAEAHEDRVTPLGYGNSPGTNRRDDPEWEPGEAYGTDSYRRAITRACDKAFPVPEEIEEDTDAVREWRQSHRWAPNQLRHSFATLVRKQFGLEAAQVLLGHAGADVTQIYAERDAEKARSVAAVVG